jgi:hypothetical protein
MKRRTRACQEPSSRSPTFALLKPSAEFCDRHEWSEPRRCRYKISHLWELPALFEEKAQLNQERVQAFAQLQRGRSVAKLAQTLNVHAWTDRHCADWLKYDVNLPEHVPLFMGGAIDGGKVLHLDEAKLKALGIDDIDCEIILARLQLLGLVHRRSQLRSQLPSKPPGPSLGYVAVLYETS